MYQSSLLFLKGHVSIWLFLRVCLYFSRSYFSKNDASVKDNGNSKFRLSTISLVNKHYCVPRVYCIPFVPSVFGRQQLNSETSRRCTRSFLFPEEWPYCVRKVLLAST